MRPVSAVRSTFIRTVGSMSWFFYPYTFWRRLYNPGRNILKLVFLALGLTLVAIRYVWPEGRGSDRKAGDENKPTGSSFPEDEEQGSSSRTGAPREAARAADRWSTESEHEPLCKRPRIREQDEKGRDEFYCEFDSTWETDDEDEDEDEDEKRSPNRHVGYKSYMFQRFERAARDMHNYRHDYPMRPRHWKSPDINSKPNLEFYLGRTPSLPDGVYVHDFHTTWFGDYDALEHVHTYIQWLFPLQEPGVNYEASVLTKAEIQDFLQNATAKENLLKSYKLMLDFYGIELCDEKTGQVQRSENWYNRFNNLNNHTHNNLRITRILKCLATLGYPHFQEPLVHFFLKETLVNGELPNVRDSVLNYFLFAVVDKTQRRNLLEFAYCNYDRNDEFVWCPKKIQLAWFKKREEMCSKTDAFVGERNPSVLNPTADDEPEEEVHVSQTW